MQLLNHAKTAKVLGVSKSKLHRLASQRKIRFSIDGGGHRFFDAKDIKQYKKDYLTTFEALPQGANK